MAETHEKTRKSSLASAFVRIADTSPLDLLKGVKSIASICRKRRVRKHAELVASIVRAIRE